MAARGSMFRMSGRNPLTAGTLLTFMATTFGAVTFAQDGWTVAPSNSVLVESNDFPAGPATGNAPLIPENVAGFREDGVAIGDDGMHVAKTNRFYEPVPGSGAYNGNGFMCEPYGQQGCNVEGCAGGCPACAGSANQNGYCGPRDPFCWLRKKEGICWVGRADALILWRDAPPGRPLVDTGLAGLPVLNAHGMDSEAAAGPRLSLFRFNQCNGTGWETTYLRAANWRSQRPLSLQNDSYALSPPGIYGNDNTQNFDVGNANLGSRLQSLEFNRHWSKGEHLRFLAGFRWVEWQEDFSLATTFNGPPTFQDFYNTSSINSLYGGQIGLDAWLLSLPWMRIDSVIKAGAYYNNGVQSSLYRSNATGDLVSQGITVNESPVGCAFVGELGFTGVVPITSCLDFRFGYFGLWLSGLVQPTQQLNSQVLTQPAGGVDPTAGSINANGGTLVQGVSLGLEGRW